MATVRATHGDTAERAMRLGDANGADAIYVESTGYFHGLRVGERRWVTGSAVDEGVDIGMLVELHEDGEPARAAKPRKAAARKTAAKKTAASKR